MVTRFRSFLLASFVAAAGLGGCDTILGPDGQTRIFFSQASSAGASFSVSPSEHEGSTTPKGSAVLALVDGLEVTITAVQAQPARFIDAPESDQSWETLTLSSPATVDLLGLPSDEKGLEILSGDLPPGAYVRIRLLVSEAKLTLRAPLTLGKHTYPANQPIPVEIPSAWVKVPGAFFTVTDSEGANVNIEFDPSVSLGQLTVSGSGNLILSPVMRGKR